MEAMNDGKGKKKLKKSAELAVFVSVAGCVFLACAWWFVAEIESFDPTASSDLLAAIAAVTGIYLIQIFAGILLGGCFIYGSVAIGVATLAVKKYVLNEERTNKALVLAIMSIVIGVVVIVLGIWITVRLCVICI